MTLPPLHRGVLLRRYKRFLADVRLDDGREVTAHCANPGRMTSCMAPGWTVWLSHHDNPKRKLKWSWELSITPDGAPILVNTARPNAVVKEAVHAGHVAALRGYERVRTEVRYGTERSRIDLLLEEPGQAWVEVKSVSLLTGPGRAAFPDAVSARGARHLRELSRLAEQGDRAVLLFQLSRPDAQSVSPARDVDPAYGRALDQAVAAGVEVLAQGVEISDPLDGPVTIGSTGALPVVLD
jgi:sugar fermentation stimulation protein A